MLGQYLHKEIENKVRVRWRKINLLNLLQKKNEKGEPYFLLDGPPYANNIPHIGHIRNTVYKDFYIRRAFMQGKNVLFQPGFDTHGLPIENMVEKKLNLKSKKDIEVLGIKKFCDTCKENAANFKDDWMRTYDKLGSWYSWKEPYLTYNNDYIESIWWSFKQLWDKGMVYEGKKPVFWCPKCETALAGYEATDKYTDVQDPLIIVKFKVKNTEKDYLLVFTTTPWTLPANVAVVAKEDEDYVKVQTSEGNLILAKNLISLLDEIKIEHKVVEEFKGKKLDGLRYESVVDVPAQKELEKNPNALRVYMSIPILKERVASKIQSKKGVESKDLFEHFVSVNEGTGLVHCAPGHGKTDNLVGKHYNLPEVSPLDDQCKFTDQAGKYEGKFVKSADSEIMDDMKKKGVLLYAAKLTHSYPLCWRCSSPLIFRMSNQWFLKTDMIKDDMLRFNEEVNWQPDFAQERFRSWVANAEDWNFSRQRFWGVPIPIWKSDDGELFVAGSKKDLENKLGKNLDEDFDLHTISGLKLKSDSGKDLKAIGDIFDVWFDSGSAPFAAFHYPFENKEIFEKHYPVDRINESQDQIRGWFYSLMFCGVATFGKAPYKTISMPGWVVDKDGEKMSKSLGNFVGAEEAMEKFGADNVRFYYCSDIDPSSLAKFNPDTVKQEAGRFHNTLWNLHKLLVTQVQAEAALKNDFKIISDLGKEKLEVEDEWILSKLSSMIYNVKQYYKNFRLHLAGREISDFVMNDLSRTYVQLVRERLDDDKLPLSIIHYSLLNSLRILAPISPFVSDEIYYNFKEHISEYSDYNYLDSIHLELLPGTDKNELVILDKFKKSFLEESFVYLLDAVSAVLAARDNASIGIRWPVKDIIVETSDDVKVHLKKLESVLLRFVNAKSVNFKKGPSKIEIKVNFRNLGKAFGQETGDVATVIKEKEQIIKEKIGSGEKEFMIGPYKLISDYFEVSVLPAEGYSMGEFKSGKAFIKSELDEDMMPEGFSREIVRRIQMLRKNMNLQKKDRIELSVEADDDLLKMISPFSESLKEKVGANALHLGKAIFKHDEILEDKVKSKNVLLKARKI